MNQGQLSNGWLTIEDIISGYSQYPKLLLQQRIQNHVNHYRLKYISVRQNFNGTWQVWEMKGNKTGIPYEPQKTKEGALEKAEKIAAVSNLEIKIFEWKNPPEKLERKKR